MSEAKLLELKKRIINRKQQKNNPILFELQELNESFSSLKDVISDSKDLKEIKTNLNISEKIDNLSSNMSKVNENVVKLYEKDITPNVIVPNKVDVKKFPNKYPIDWENAPKQKDVVIDTHSPIKTLYKSIESLLEPFLGKVSGFMNKVVTYIQEPNKVIITDTKITEHYGSRSVVYNIRENTNGREIIREVK